MKRVTMLLVAILIVCSAASAQFSQNWEKLAALPSGPDGHWYLAPGTNNLTSLTYNQATGHVLVGNRNTGIYITDATTGAVLDSLKTTGLTLSAWVFNVVRATSDGVIYAVQMISAAGTLKIYRWESETADPTVAFSGYIMVRTGDAFAVAGTGANTILYASGSGSTKIYRFTTADGSTFGVKDSIIVASGLARGGIWPVGADSTSALWVNSSGNPAKKISTSGAALSTPVSSAYTYNVPNDSIHTGFHRVTYFETGGNKYLIVVGRNSASYGKYACLYNISASETNPTLYGSAVMSGTMNTNANATGDAAVKDNGDGTVTVFELVTNNGIASWKTTTPPLPVQMTSFTATALNSGAALAWSTASEVNCAGFEIQRRRAGGSEWSVVGFMQGAGTTSEPRAYTFHDTPSEPARYAYRLIQIDKDGTRTALHSAECETGLVPSTMELLRSYPNPFNPSTTIDFSSAQDGRATVRIYTVLGQLAAEVFNGDVKAGRMYTAVFNASRLASGVYMARFEQAGTARVIRMLLAK